MLAIAEKRPKLFKCSSWKLEAETLVMVIVETATPAPYAAPIRPQRWWRRLSETYLTMRTLTVARQQAFKVHHFRPQHDRYIIFADVHRGDGNPLTDDFVHNENTYLHALRYYLDSDFRLVLNGDIEECWKSNIQDIIARYADTAYALEREFVRKGPDYYLRTYGNHDLDWAVTAQVRQHLQPVLGESVHVYPAISLGDYITIAHGHQGDFASDRISAFSRWFVREVWRPLQLRFGISQDLKFARNNTMKTSRDRNLWRWALQHQQLLIAGHTHRAILQPQADLERQYVNTGACVHRDGLTGIEIDQGEMRLIRWAQPSPTATPRRIVLNSAELARMIAAPPQKAIFAMST